ncbi:PREDICTED: uncharacterized protein LOC106819510 [Priapulus caudatus]|uniref:Uncharacterized protein LOC106819510 n=1 Tax=Priapulus caudatus TaxID=37621 RepID=A0ABM1F599_PRICU|nr:PREDICTED: uncharacterized protein LOC106819510 [Priapulus caudatus]
MREIPVNVWVADVAVEHLPQVPGINVKSAIFDVAFSQGDAPEWVPGSLAHEEIIVAANARITYILEGSTEEATAFMTTNFYDFYMGMPLVTDFSIEECTIGVGNEMITKIYYNGNVIYSLHFAILDRNSLIIIANVKYYGAISKTQM